MRDLRDDPELLARCRDGDEARWRSSTSAACRASKSRCEPAFAAQAANGLRTKLSGLSTVCLVALVCGCADEVPCLWDTMPTDERSALADRELETPGLALVCGTDTYPVGAHYRNDVSPNVELSTLEILMVPLRYPDNYFVSFPATWPDGTYDSSDVGLVADRSTAATFSFTRSRDVPFVDVSDPEPRIYESSIDFALDMEIVDTGCRLSTTETVHIVQSGPVRTCTSGTVGLR